MKVGRVVRIFRVTKDIASFFRSKKLEVNLFHISCCFFASGNQDREVTNMFILISIQTRSLFNEFWERVTGGICSGRRVRLAGQEFSPCEPRKPHSTADIGLH